MQNKANFKNRSQKTEVRKQKSEDWSQKTEVRVRSSFLCPLSSVRGTSLCLQRKWLFFKKSIANWPI